LKWVPEDLMTIIEGIAGVIGFVGLLLVILYAVFRML
jgi:hypothetical protein